MRKLLITVADAPYRLMAMTAMASIAATEAQAANGVGALADHVKTNFQQVGDFVIAAGQLGGFAMGGMGLMKLKAAVDDPQRTKVSEGLWRVAIGGCLTAIPAVAGVGVSTFFDGPGTAPQMGSGTFTN